MAGSLVKNDYEIVERNDQIMAVIHSFLDNTYPEAVLISEWGEPNKSLMAELKRVFAFLLSMPSVPFVYYGDEICMKQLRKAI